MIRFGSVCSGIEAASVAWHPLGWRAAWLAEIEPFPSAVLAHHYPDTPNLGDMTALPARIANGEIEAPDVFCGGTPCQAFSVAGLRKSLDDARGNLSLTFVEIADAIDRARRAQNLPECVVFWENVPGVLSTADNAFGCFLGGLAGENVSLVPPGPTPKPGRPWKWPNAGAVFGPQRAIAWRVLDAQYFGVAQRRRRVFVVASARKGFDPTQVLFEWDGVRRDSAPSREAGQTAPTTPARSTAGGGLGTDFDCDGGVVQVCPTPRAGGNRTGGDTPPGTDVDTADSLIVQTAHTLRGEGFDASEDGTGRGTPLVPHVVGALACNTGPNGHDAGNFACNQAVDAGHVLPVAFAENSRHELRLEGGDGQRTGALSTGGGKPGQGVPMIAFPANLSGTQCASTEDLTPAMGAANPTAVAFQERGREGGRALEIGGDVAYALTAPSGGGRAQERNVLTPAMQVRRLTPQECEALQGFPRGHTAIPWRGKPAEQCPDGPRYKALGNSWAVPNVTWIGQRIDAHLKSPCPVNYFLPSR
jgi:DNA (cytosine-5)-methyltransferase 1